VAETICCFLRSALSAKNDSLDEGFWATHFRLSAFIVARRWGRERVEVRHVVPNSKYVERWSLYRQSFRWGVSVMMVWILGTLIASSVTGLNPILWFVITAAWFFVTNRVFVRMGYGNPMNLLCPRCDRRFFYSPTSLFHNAFARRCMNCGLPKFAEADA
jgi:hypothetical protein